MTDPASPAGQGRGSLPNGHDEARPGQVRIRSLQDGDRSAVARFLEQQWGSAVQVAHGTVFRPAELPGLIAQAPGEPAAGLLTYEVRGAVLEIVTLNAVPRRTGIGTALIEEAVAEAARRGCREVRLTTTNDNIAALRFYQRRGFRLVELRPGAVTRARRAKPEIPMTGEHGIPLRDELDLIRSIPLCTRMSGRDPPGGRYRTRPARDAHLRLSSDCALS
jgi:GNAT superfamily N-acetyltransferase